MAAKRKTKKVTPKKSKKKTAKKSKPKAKKAAKRGKKKTLLQQLLPGVAGLAILIAIGLSVSTGSRKPASPTGVKGVTTEAKLKGLELEFSQLQSKSLEERLEHWSGRLEQNPNLLGEITRGVKAPSIDDTAPLVPVAFNCTTFVESVIALSQSAKPADFYAALIAIRYRDGKTTFASRNHFPEADWIPVNTRAGILKDVTKSVFDGKAMTVQKTINRGKWMDEQAKNGRVDRAIASASEDWRKPVDVKLSYLPWREVALVEKKIPSGVVANLVRPDHARHPVLITHQGFVFQKDGKTIFRHSTPRGQIRTVGLTPYLESIFLKGPKDWAIVGINLNKIN